MCRASSPRSRVASDARGCWCAEQQALPLALGLQAHSSLVLVLPTIPLAAHLRNSFNTRFVVLRSPWPAAPAQPEEAQTAAANNTIATALPTHSICQRDSGWSLRVDGVWLGSRTAATMTTPQPVHRSVLVKKAPSVILLQPENILGETARTVGPGGGGGGGT